MTLQDFANISEIVVAIVAFASPFIAWLTLRDSKKRQKRAKAMDLACCFKDVILKDHEYFMQCIEGSEFHKANKECFPYEEIQYFDKKEMESLIKKSKSKYKNSDDFNKLISEININCIISASVSNKGYMSYVENVIPITANNDDKMKKILIEQHYKNEFINKITDLLNTLEWFSMNFVSGVADGDIVYQSLHQNFLALVHQLYFFISRTNETEHEKFYTNIIELFSNWSEKRNKVIKKEKKLEEKTKCKSSKLIKKKRKI